MKNIIPKTPRYWELHKKIFQLHFDELDSSIQNLVLTRPESQEALSFEKRIEREVKEKLKN